MAILKPSEVFFCAWCKEKKHKKDKKHKKHKRREHKKCLNCKLPCSATNNISSNSLKLFASWVLVSQ